MKLADEIKYRSLRGGGPGSGPRPGGYERALMNVQPNRIKEMLKRLSEKVKPARSDFKEDGWGADYT